MKCFIIVAILFVGALAAPSANIEEPKHEIQQEAVQSTQLVAAEEDVNAREKKSAYYKHDDYKSEPVNAIYPKPPGPCAVPVLVSCKTQVDYGKLEYKPHYEEYKPEYKPHYEEYKPEYKPHY